MIVLSSEKCVPCKLLKEELKRKGIDFIEVDIETSNGREIARKYGIIGVPAIIRDGKVVMVGYNKEKLNELVERGDIR